ncbi:MAG: M20 family metallopeptidase [Tenuifilaceae bacterium]|jgi:amidohydrolase|nr:M20 family metallopeptidase [Tenuifilaceae bacterium]
MLNSIRQLAFDQHNAIVEFRRYLHQHPELSFQEVNTAKHIAKELESIGIPFFDGIGGTGILALIEGDVPGPTVGIRAELDALPIQEQTELKFASINANVMHACGHDVHMANLIGAARILWKLRHLLKGNVLLIFQPGEEVLPGGAQSIIESPEFNKYKPSLMLGMHILPELTAGKVGFKSGAYMASGDEIYLKVKGKGGHAALPHTLIDTVLMASHIVVALQQLVSRNSPVEIPTVLSFGKVIANGATNIIPDVVNIEGTFRTMDETWRETAHDNIRKIATGIAQGMGGECEVEIRKGYPTLYNNPDFTRVVVDLTSEYMGTNNIVKLSTRMTTDDFARFAQVIPSVYFRIGSGFPKGEAMVLHSSKLLVDEHVLEQSGGLLAWIAINMLDKHL